MLDLADRAVLDWTLGNNMTAKDTTIATLKKTLNNRQLKEDGIIHSDRGTQYACHDFRQLVQLHRAQLSMSRKANCWDNAVAESFFKTIKTECIDRYNFET